MVQHIKVKKILSFNQHKDEGILSHRAHRANEIYTRAFAMNQNTIFTNTIDYSKKFMKLHVTREELEEGKFDTFTNILYTRKISHLMYDYCKRLARKMKDY
jgi:hypothetical protein